MFKTVWTQVVDFFFETEEEIIEVELELEDENDYEFMNRLFN